METECPVQVVDVLGDAEDALWELEDEQVVVAVQQALARMCEVVPPTPCLYLHILINGIPWGDPTGRIGTTHSCTDAELGDMHAIPA